MRSHALLGIPARSGCIAWRCKPVLQQQRRKQMTSSQRASAAFAKQPVAEDADTPAQPHDYVFVDNLRLVRPYYFDFKCFVKQRWNGLTLVQLFSQEFPSLSEAYYTEAFRTGRLRVEGAPHLGLSTPLKTGMCVRHMIHRHEPPVLAGDVQVIGQTDEFVAVCKPACMPVHTVGQYRKNTVLGVLQAQCPELGTLYPTYRLDKPVSGLLLLAKTSAVAAKMRKLLEERGCSKAYLARVLGSVPPLKGHAPSSSGMAPTPSDDPQAPAATSGQQGGAAVVSEPRQADGAEVAVQEKAAGEGQAGASTPTAQGVDAASDGDGGAGASQRVAAGVGTETEVSSSSRHIANGQGATEGQEAAAGGAGGTQEEEARLRLLSLPGVSVLPDGWLEVNVPLSWDATTNHVTAVPPGTSLPGQLKHGQEPKEAITHFRLVNASAAGTSSTVEARPKTGRTHQIRVHLQYIGHPIANDTQYGGTYGPPLAFRLNQPRDALSSGDAEESANAAKRARRDERSSPSQQQQQQQQQQEQQQQQVKAAPASASHISAFLGGDSLNQQLTGGELPDSIQQLYSQDKYRVEPELLETVCPHCPSLVPKGYPIDLEPLWLHAMAYSGPGWAFEAPPPDWADPEFVPKPRTAAASLPRATLKQLSSAAVVM